MRHLPRRTGRIGGSSYQDTLQRHSEQPLYATSTHPSAQPLTTGYSDHSRIPPISQQRGKRTDSMEPAPPERQDHEPPTHGCGHQKHCHACPWIVHLRPVLNPRIMLSLTRLGPTFARTLRATYPTTSSGPPATLRFAIDNTTVHLANGAVHPPTSTHLTHLRAAPPRYHTITIVRTTARGRPTHQTPV